MEGTVTNKQKLTGTLSSGGSMVGGVGTVFGKDGKSAYEVAVKNGFEGSETEWLASLKGEQGKQGDRGNPGVYVGSGDMPEDCNVQIDPNGEPFVIAQDYYFTEREEIGVSHENINTAYIWGLYDALIAEHPDNVQKISIQSDNESFTNYVYEISTGEYCPTVKTVYGTQFSADEHIKKPKYLVLNAFHGNERKTVFSTYRFIRDVLKGHNVPQVFKEGATIQIMPVANPVGFNAFEYRKPNGVDINHNFDWNWEEGKSSGAYPASEPETQVITKWLNDNSDAELFIDFHNNGMVNENVAIIGTPDNDNTERVKKIALRGIDRVIPFWRDVIGYDSFVVPVMGETSITDEREEKDVVFAYSVSAEIGGSAFNYAQLVLGIPSFVMETSSYYGDYDEWQANKTSYPAETIAMGAEALGNILIELFSESFEVIDMSEVNNKLDALLATVNSGFHSVSGSFTLESDIEKYSDYSVPTYRIDCPSGAKLIVFEPDAPTYAEIKTRTDTNYTMGARCSFTNGAGDAYAGVLSAWAGKTQKTSHSMFNATNDNGVGLYCLKMAAGTYEWIAYYWNE
jgi:predicted deacylase